MLPFRICIAVFNQAHCFIHLRFKAIAKAHSIDINVIIPFRFGNFDNNIASIRHRDISRGNLCPQLIYRSIS